MSKYQPYPKYKDSELSWLGEIPIEWQASKLKYNASIYNGNSISDSQKSNYENHEESMSIPYISTKDLNADYFTIKYDNGLRVLNKSKSSFKIANESSTLICIEGGSAGKKLAYLHKDVCFVNKLACIESLKGQDAKYLNYFLHSDLFKYSFELATTGLIPGVSIAELKDIIYLCPPFQEQQTIANYLDKATAKIDTLIEKQVKLIELLKEKRQAVISTAVTRGLDSTVTMKGSGVEWLGNIPEHWVVHRIGNLFTEAVEYGKTDLPILRVSIHDGVSDREYSSEEMDRKVARSEDRSKYKCVEPDDLVYNMMRAWQGGFGAVKVNGLVSPAYVVARPMKAMSTSYIELLLRTVPATEELRRYSRGITDFRLRLYWNEFKNIKVVLPPKEEIDRILAYITNQGYKIDSLVMKSDRAIVLLKERRIALISAAVTGKIDVRNK